MKIHLGQKLASLVLIFWSVFVMAEEKQINKEYWLTYFVNNALVDIRVNGAPVYKSSDPDPDNESIPVSGEMMNGKNVITINFSEAVIENEKMIVDKEGEDSDFEVYVKLNSMGNFNDAEVDLIRIKKTKKGYTFEEKNLQGKPFSQKTQYVKVGDRSTVKKNTFVDDSGNFLVDSYSIDVEVNISGDSFRNVVWMNGKKIDLSDVSIKQKIINKYKAIYSWVQQGDFSKIKNEVYHVWDNAAYAYNLGDGDYYIESTEPESDLVANPEDGSVLVPFNYDENSYKFELMGEGRLVRLQPAPVRWKFDDGSESIYAFVFFLTEEDEVKVATIAND